MVDYSGPGRQGQGRFEPKTHSARKSAAYYARVESPCLLFGLAAGVGCFIGKVHLTGRMLKIITTVTDLSRIQAEVGTQTLFARLASMGKA